MKVIIAAGSALDGLWPLSKEIYPESLSGLYDAGSMLQNVYKLALSAADERNILIAANGMQLHDIKNLLKKHEEKLHILAAPQNRGSAAAIAAALYSLQGKKDETIIIMPANISIKSPKAFKEAVEEAKTAVKKGYTALIGVKKPDAECGMGYIQAGETKKNITPALKAKTAPGMHDEIDAAKNGNIYWNTGIYVSKISILLDGIEKYAPETAEGFSAEMSGENNTLNYECWAKLPDISFDASVIENLEKTAVIHLKSKYKYYGDWQSIYKCSERDKNGNVCAGDAAAYGAADSLIFSSKGRALAAGVSGITVINTEDALLVCSSDRTADIQKMEEAVKNHYKDKAGINKTEISSEGAFTCIYKSAGLQIKSITIYPHGKIPAHMHNYRTEHWTIAEGEAEVTIENRTAMLNKGSSADIPAGIKHSLLNLSDEPVKIIEIQRGSYIGEDDIIIFNDIIDNDEEETYIKQENYENE